MLTKENGSSYIKIKTKHFILLMVMLSVGILSYIYHSIYSDQYNYFKMEKVFNIIQEHYKGEVTRKELYQKAIKGSIENLDKYSFANIHKKIKKYNKYINKNSIFNNSYIGVGVVFEEVKNGLLITDIYQDSDLYSKTNIGDVVFKINDKKYNGNFEEFLTMLKGSKGELKSIDIINNKKEIKNHTLKIKEIKKDFIQAKIINDYIYIKIKEFSENLTEDFMDKIEEVSDYDILQYKGLIIDLADNSGGLFKEGLMFADTLISVNNELALTSQYQQKNDFTEYRLSQGDFVEGIPIAVIINKKSASSSEIFAGIFKDFERGIIVGQKSYGKGVGQSVFNFNEDIEIGLTTFEFFIGKDKKKINNIGIYPDFVIKEDYLKNKNLYINKAMEELGKLKNNI
jgi:carboxyl-terminal processing protease